MVTFIELLKAALIGLVQGITEWLPVSSTGHMILLDELIKLNVTPEFASMFRVVIQLGSIFAVLTIYFKKLNPFSRKKTPAENKRTFSLWIHVIVAAIPAAIIGLLFDDWFDEIFYNYIVVAIALIVYGVAFIFIEKLHPQKRPHITECEDIDYKTAIGIGIFQILSLVPGTSRSGSTILGGIILGVSRTAAAEFSFFLAIPVMLGASLLKILKFGFTFTAIEIAIMITGMIVAFVVSVIAIRFLMSFVRNHSFEVFGWYRIVLGVIVLLWFMVN